MSIKLKIYNKLVNRVPYIQKKYHSLRQQKRGLRGRVYAWCALLGMNIIYHFAPKKYEEAFYYPDKGKKIPTDCSESSLSLREAPEKLAERLKKYDVISFDVFDTLVFRPFAAPSDLFFMIGEKLNYLDFERIRKVMEWRARQKAKEKKGIYEVTLSEIYDELEKQAGIPKEKGMQTEIDTELQYCFGNPYMLEVFKCLKGCGKKIICTSDMYLPASVIKRMVEKCGFNGVDTFFISCEHDAVKGDGGLFKVVKDFYGKDKTYIHVGDHPVSDITWAKKSGFDTEFYQNVNIAGMPYRAEDMSIITGSMYRGIVNSHIHNGLKEYSREYELGFIYGGLFVLGYCQWIHDYVEKHDIDKILFLSRDGDIINQVYTMLYPEEAEAGRTEYVYWSRLAATKMSARYFKYDYFRRFIDHKVNQKYTLEQIFKSMELEDMLPIMCETFPEYAETLLSSADIFGKNDRMVRDVRKEAKITVNTKLTDQNAWLIKEYLIAHWDEVLSHYEEQLIAGKMYYEKVLKDCKRVVAVDIGWAGSGAVALNYIVNEEWKLDCEVIGLLAGTNTIHNAEPNMSEPQLYSGKLVSYMYSQGHNRDIWKWHDAAKGHNVAVELLFGSVKGSLRGFFLAHETNGKNYTVCLKKADVEEKIVREIHRGIVGFVQWVKGFNNEVLLKNIIGNDVYGAIKLFIAEDNYETYVGNHNDLRENPGIEVGI